MVAPVDQPEEAASDIEKTDELPVLDVASYEATLRRDEASADPAAPEANVGQTCVLDIVEASYHGIPRTACMLTSSVCYTPALALHSPRFDGAVPSSDASQKC